MKLVQQEQGSESWKAWRRSMFPASEAPEAAGVGYGSAAKYLREYGQEKPAPNDFTQSLFNLGHQAEAAALPIAEERIGEKLSPCVGVIEPQDFPKGTSAEIVEALTPRLSASFDGIDLDGKVIWEHKLWSQKIAEAHDAGKMIPKHTLQIQQQLMISGASTAYFMASDPRKDIEPIWIEVAPDLHVQEQILSVWMEFLKKLSARNKVETINLQHNKDWQSLELEQLEIDTQMSGLKKRSEEVRQAFAALANGRNVIGGQYGLTHVARSGSIAYSKAIKELLPDADLEKYRGESVQTIQLKRSSK